MDKPTEKSTVEPMVKPMVEPMYNNMDNSAEKSLFKQFDTKRLVHIGLLIALQIIFTRVLSIEYGQILRISFAFIPMAMVGIAYGPVYGGTSAAIANLLGAVLRGISPFPGFVLSAFLGGAIYGLLLHKQPKKIWRIATAVALICGFVNIGLNTLWVHMLTGNPFFVLLPIRSVQNGIMAVVMVFTIWAVVYPIMEGYNRIGSRAAA